MLACLAIVSLYVNFNRACCSQMIPPVRWPYCPDWCCCWYYCCCYSDDKTMRGFDKSPTKALCRATILFGTTFPDSFKSAELCEGAQRFGVFLWILCLGEGLVIWYIQIYGVSLKSWYIPCDTVVPASFFSSKFCTYIVHSLWFLSFGTFSVLEIIWKLQFFFRTGLSDLVRPL